MPILKNVKRKKSDLAILTPVGHCAELWVFDRTGGKKPCSFQDIVKFVHFSSNFGFFRLFVVGNLKPIQFGAKRCQKVPCNHVAHPVCAAFDQAFWFLRTSQEFAENLRQAHHMTKSSGKVPFVCMVMDLRKLKKKLEVIDTVHQVDLL